MEQQFGADESLFFTLASTEYGTELFMIPLQENPLSLELLSQSDGPLHLLVVGPSGLGDELQESPDLGTWDLLVKAVIPMDGRFTFQISPAQSLRYFRAVAQPDATTLAGKRTRPACAPLSYFAR